MNKRLKEAVEALEKAQRDVIALTCDLVQRITDPLFMRAQQLFNEGWRYTYFEHWEGDDDSYAMIDSGHRMSWRGWEVAANQLPAKKGRSVVRRYLADLTVEEEGVPRWEKEEAVRSVASSHAQLIFEAWWNKTPGVLFVSPYVTVAMASVTKRVLRIAVRVDRPDWRHSPVPPDELMAKMAELKSALEAFNYQVVVA